MSCKYLKDVDMLLDHGLDQKKNNELKMHCIQCEECSQKINKIESIDNLVKDTLVSYYFVSNKSEIMNRIEAKRKRTEFWANLYYARKPAYILISCLIVALLFAHGKPVLDMLMIKVQPVIERKINVNDLKFPISSEEVRSIYMPGEDYKISNENLVINLPLMKPNDPKSEAYAKEIIDRASRERIEYINKWTNYVNSSTKFRQSTQDEINRIGYKDITPVTLWLKDGRYIHLYPMIQKTETRETIQGKLTVKTPYMDRYIICYESESDNGKKLSYYTVLSKSPLVQQLTDRDEKIYHYCSIKKVGSDGKLSSKSIGVEGDLLKENDKMVISGFSTAEDSFDIYITDSSELINPPPGTGNSPKEVHKIVHIDSITGEWSIERTISQSMETNDGQKFNLDRKLYFYEIDHIFSGLRDAYSGGLADLSK